MHHHMHVSVHKSTAHGVRPRTTGQSKAGALGMVCVRARMAVVDCSGGKAHAKPLWCLRVSARVPVRRAAIKGSVLVFGWQGEGKCPWLQGSRSVCGARQVQGTPVRLPHGNARVTLASAKQGQSRCCVRSLGVRSRPWLGCGVLGVLELMVVTKRAG